MDPSNPPETDTESSKAAIQVLEAEVKLLQEKLEFFNARPQVILDLVAAAITKKLEEGDMSVLNIARQFLRDQGILDLRNGDTPINHLAKQYPFAAKSEGGDDYGVKLEAE